MAARITTLIGSDNVELMRDEIAAILVLESAAQVVLANAAGQQPSDDWKLRIYIDRTSPWDQWLHRDAAGNDPDVSPVVNVTFDRASYDKSRSDPVERQLASTTYNIDCYGYGLSADNGDGTHVAAEKAAAANALHAAVLVRNILMAGTYTYLGHQGLVWNRWISDLQSFSPPKDERTVDNVRGCRLVLQVDMNEFSPQVQGQTIELISTEVRRDTITGQLLLQTDITV